MNFYKKILKIIIAILLWINFCFGADLIIDLELLNTSQFTLNYWKSYSDLWKINITNPNSDSVNYRLKLTISEDIAGDLIEGYTKFLNIDANKTVTYKNLDPIFNQDILGNWNDVSGFTSNIENQTGYLPPGNYTLKLEAFSCPPNNFCCSNCEEIGLSWDNIYIPLGDQFSIELPEDGSEKTASNLMFQWNTPAFRQGIKIEFKLIIAAIVDSDISTPEEAIDMGPNEVYYYDSDWNAITTTNIEWPWEETGIPKQLNVWYNQLLTNSEAKFSPFKCGFSYAWRMEAREVIDDFETPTGSRGIWGWPESKKSEIRTFIWGSEPRGLITPSPNDVLPIFDWDELWCSAGKYDLQISNIDDNLFEESWEISNISSAFQYPADAPGLIPGDSYRWRVRLYTPPDESFGEANWSQSNIFTINNIELIEPQNGQILESVRPVFNISSPINIGHYELLIGDGNDEYVEQVEVYNGEQKIISFPWQYPAQNIENGLFPDMIYYWKLLMFDNSENLLGEIDDYEVMGNFRIMPIILDEPANGSSDISFNQKFTWNSPMSVTSYEFWLSDNQDPEVLNPNIIINIVGSNSLDYPENGEFPLQYAQNYYWKIVPKDINDNYGLPESYSAVSQFTTLDFPELGENISTSDSDPRVPIIDILTLNGIKYTIFIYSDSDGSTIIEEITGVTNFPYEYVDGKETLQYGTTYYIQVQPMKDGYIFGNPSNIMLFNIPDEPENTEQCVISCEITGDENPEILTSILSGLEDATEYLILVSENEDMSGALEFPIASNQSQYTISDNISWGNTYYTQVVALSSDGETLGLASDIQMVNIESKPGMNEQTAISIILSEGSMKPTFEIINEITGANSYLIVLSTESDMSTDFFQFEIANSLIAEYPSDGPSLQFGKSYYVNAQGLDDGVLHGIISSTIGIYIPNVIAPVLGEAFNWESSIPASNSYNLLISKVEDFSTIEFDFSIQGNSYDIKIDELEYNMGYYWKIQGFDSEGNIFGNSSLTSFFITPSVPEPILNIHSTEVSLYPEFSFSAIEIASSYKILVGSDGSMENILWEENLDNTSIIYPESAFSLEYASTYYWQVFTLDGDEVILSKSSIELFSTSSIYPVIDLSPNGGVETLSPLLQWEGNDRITSYSIIIELDGEQIVNEEVEGNSYQISEGILQPDKSYNWTIDGLDDNSESLAGKSTPAIIVSPSLDNILLISPAADAQVNNLNPILKWSALLGVSSYTVDISIDSEFESLIINNIVSGTEIIVPDDNRLSNSTSYFWRVQGATETAEIISNIGIFTTPSSEGITVKELEDEAVISLTNPIFSWEANEGISAFSIRFSEKADLSESWNFQTGSSNFEYPGSPDLNFNIPYYWQVSPLNNEGNPIGDWSTIRTFSISAAFIVELILPANDEIVTTSKPAFQWDVLDGVEKYEIQVSNIEDFSEILWSSPEIIEGKTTYPSSGSEPLDIENTYYWRVRAMGENLPLGDFSSTFSFSLSGENKVELEGPLNEQSESILPYFSWFSINGASSYLFNFSSDDGMSSIIYTESTSEVFLQYTESAPPLNNGSVYYWQVTALDENGSPIGDPSNIGLFNTPEGSIEIEFMFGDD